MQIDSQTLISVGQGVFSALVGFFVWVAKRTLNEIESNIEKTHAQIELVEKRLSEIESKMSVAGKESEFVRHEVGFIRTISEDVAVLKRDQKSIWGRIDELRIKFDAINDVFSSGNRRKK